MRSLENQFLFYCSGKAKSLIWATICVEALCSEGHVYIIYHTIKESNIHQENYNSCECTTSGSFLPPGFHSLDSRGTWRRKPSSTSFSCAPHCLQWQDPFQPMGTVEGKQELHYFHSQWNTIKMTTLVGCSMGVWN